MRTSLKNKIEMWALKAYKMFKGDHQATQNHCKYPVLNLSLCDEALLNMQKRWVLRQRSR